MTFAFLLQFVLSLAAVGGLVGLSAWLGRPRAAPALTDAAARRLIGEEEPEADLQSLWIAPDGAGAVGRTSAGALVLFRLGDGWVMRAAPWSAITAAKIDRGRALVRLGDPAAPTARLALGPDDAWPPQELRA